MAAHVDAWRLPLTEGHRSINGQIRVGPALGDRVRRGQTLAEIYSPTLAEAQTRYVSAQAMLDAHDRELQRTQKLVEIGAESRQELENIHAEHEPPTAAVQSARSQLELLGVSASALDNTAPGRTMSASTTVPAPIDGVVIERGANDGVGGGGSVQKGLLPRARWQ